MAIYKNLECKKCGHFQLMSSHPRLPYKCPKCGSEAIEHKWYDRAECPPNVIPHKPQSLTNHTQNQDLVNHPAHYNEYGLENLEAIEGSMSPIEYQGFLKASALKYIYRFRLKGNPVMDLDKAINYLTMLKDRMEEME